MSRRSSFLAVSACLAVLLSAPVGSQEPPLDTLLARMSRYAAEYRRQLSGMVAEETYVQDMRTTFTGQLTSGAFTQPVTHRELKSDVLLVRLAAHDGYAEFRDVYEVDGKPVRDRQERLLALFMKPPENTAEQLQRILAEGARYNIGSVIRTINTPTVPLMFIEQEFQPRFRFSIVKERSVSQLGVEKNHATDGLLVVGYREGPKNTIIRRPNGLGDLPTQGRFWIEPETGRVRLSELLIEDPIVRTVIDVAYEVDPALGHLVPIEMRERYDNTHDRSIIEGRATYAKFRRFGVSTDETIDAPKK
jgi:hypothetical protein